MPMAPFFIFLKSNLILLRRAQFFSRPYRGISQITIVMALFLSGRFALAKDATIFDVRRPLALDDSEKPPKDFYLNAGSQDGLRVGMILKVSRRQSLYDAYQQKSPGELVVPVGEIRVIHVQGDLSVARLEEIDKRDRLPVLEFDAIMVGDRVDLASARMAPRQTASTDIPSTDSAVETAPVGITSVQIDN